MIQQSKKTIYIDVSNTINILHTTGIQRVVKKFSAEFQFLGEKNIFFVKFMGDGRYRKVKVDWQKVDTTSKSSKGYLSKLLDKLWIFLKVNTPDSIKRFRKRLLIAFEKKFEKFFGSIFYQKNLVTAKKGDLFLMIDASWNYNPWTEIRRLRKEGAVISHVIYDLLPLKHPHFFTQELVEAFEIWSKMISYYCSNLYCISYTVKNDVQKILNPLAGNQFILIDVIPLGNNITSLAKHVRDRLVDDIDYCPKFLSVGTIEPRKNYQFLLKAFNEIWAIPGNETITWSIVGKVGWNSHMLYAELKNHPEFGRRLKLFVDANDEQLTTLYEESTCVIAASIDEGYGLPVVEAIKHNCTVLLSDIEIFREFKLNDDHYFSINCTADLIKKIMYEKDVSTKLVTPSINNIDWKDASKIFYEKLCTLN